MKDIILLISSGKGPRECEWVVGRLAEAIAKDAIKEGIKATALSGVSEGPSILVRVTADNAESFVKHYLGTIRWIGQSPFRPNHKRKNWFVGVSLLPAPEAVPAYNEADITYQTMKAGGPGGQHVNTTDSAVRATHTPTGLTVIAKEERSQHANKRLAQMKIAALLQNKSQENTAASHEAQWEQHQNLERGNEIRTYEGPKFKLKR